MSKRNKPRGILGRAPGMIRQQQGQSTVEFSLTLILLMAFILFFFQLSMVLGFSNYVQYATFMAARAYFAAGVSVEDQQTRARNVIVQMLKRSESNPSIDRFPTVAKGEGGGDIASGLSFDAPQYNSNDKNFSWLQGIRYTFKGRIFVLPFGKGSARPSDETSVTLTSESFLGRETTFEECSSEMSSRRDGGIFDNGC